MLELEIRYKEQIYWRPDRKLLMTVGSLVKRDFLVAIRIYHLIKVLLYYARTEKLKCV